MQKEGLRLDFLHIAHRLYKRCVIPFSFDHGRIRCENLIRAVYNIKSYHAESI